MIIYQWLVSAEHFGWDATLLKQIYQVFVLYLSYFSWWLLNCTPCSMFSLHWGATNRPDLLKVKHLLPLITRSLWSFWLSWLFKKWRVGGSIPTLSLCPWARHVTHIASYECEWMLVAVGGAVLVATLLSVCPSTGQLWLHMWFTSVTVVRVSNGFNVKVLKVPSLLILTKLSVKQ